MTRAAQESSEIVGDFLSKLPKHNTLYVGIDAGTSGAIGLLCGRKTCAVDIPTYRSAVVRSKTLSEKEQKQTGKKTKTVKGSIGEFDYSAICELFDTILATGHAVVVTLERVPPKLAPGPLRMADVKLYGAWSMWPLFLVSKKVVLLEPRPNEWKKKMKLAGKDKEAARQLALKLFPNCQHISRKKDHNRAEALLLALYGVKEGPV